MSEIFDEKGAKVDKTTLNEQSKKIMETQ